MATIAYRSRLRLRGGASGAPDVATESVTVLVAKRAA
jgi:hypothetical protein